MTDEQIIQAVDLCANAQEDCRKCPLHSVYSANCITKLMNTTLDLIKRQQAEIEQWKEEANRYQNLWCDAEKDISNARIEAQKDFAERLKDDVANIPAWGSVAAKKIDNLVKELTEGKDDE